MRTLCDVCERAAALYFCAADEAALCQDCDDKVHLCNKLASRHVRVAIASPSAVPRCDICENSPAFFYCEIDGSSLCLQCDTAVHVGGKRTHERYLMLRQKVEFPGNKLTEKLGAYEDQELQPVGKSGNKKEQNQEKRPNTSRNNMTNGLRHNQEPTVPTLTSRDDHLVKADSEMIDLNACPQRGHGQPSNSGQV